MLKIYIYTILDYICILEIQGQQMNVFSANDQRINLYRQNCIMFMYTHVPVLHTCYVCATMLIYSKKYFFKLKFVYYSNKCNNLLYINIFLIIHLKEKNI